VIASASTSQPPQSITGTTPSERAFRLSRLIRVLRWIRCIPVPPINRQARIHRRNQHAQPAKGAKARYCAEMRPRGEAAMGPRTRLVAPQPGSQR
jgi:hypothetical protein